jgi:hypothetical protein
MVEAFGVNAASAYITKPFPVSSQIGVTPGRASLNDGFVPLNMTPPSAGGIPPSGADMNGILYLMSTNIAALSAGQVFNVFDAAYAAAIGGYAVGAVLAQSVDASARWVNLIAGNTTNPDTGGAGWMSTKPLYASFTAASGSNNNVTLGGASDYVLDVDCTAGNVSLTGLVAQRDGQRVTIVRKDATANTLTLTSNDASSTAANRFRIVSGGLGLPLQYMTVTLQYSSTLALWVQA